jgi:uncharacterized protein YkwD
MRILKVLSKILFLLAILLLVFSFPLILNKLKTEKNQTISIARFIPPEAKIEAPVEPPEFEKTADYGILDCQNFQSNPLSGSMFDLTNAERKEDKQKELGWSALLCESAKLKAQDLISNNYFDHVSPSGVQPWYWYDQVGYKYTFSGENLALNYYTADSANEALMKSEGHRENILSVNFSQIGIAYARGKIGGQDAFVVVQHFGALAPAVPPVTYICEIDKAKKNLKELKQTQNKIEDYIEDAKKIRKELKAAGQSTKEADAYIRDMENKEEKVKEYIKETEEYLEKCGVT